MIKWQKKEIIIFIVLAALIVIIPIIIHILFKFDIGIEFLASTWESGDILQYAGTILASLLAIAGVYFTIKESRINNLENKVIENKPYLKTKITQLISFTETETLKDNKNIVCILDSNGVCSFSLSNMQGKKELIAYNEKHNIRNNFLFKYEIKNIGLGNAMSLDLKMCNSNLFPKTIICKGDVLELYTFEDKNLINNGLVIDIKFEYKDIIDVNTYEQHERLSVAYNKKEKSYIYNRDFEDEISEPVIIEKRIFN